MRSPSADARAYRIHPVIPWCGIAGSLFWLYVVLYATEAVDWVLFSKVSDFRVRITDRGAIIFLLLMLGMSVAVASSARIKVTLDSRGVVYRGCFRTVRLLWHDVTRMTYSPVGVDICLWTQRGYVRFGRLLSKGRELLGEVKENVGLNAPGAPIVQARPTFMPRLRKPEGKSGSA